MSVQPFDLPEGQRTLEIEFDIVNEGWNTYTLGNGVTVKLKTTVVKIFQVIDKDGNAATTPEGDPLVMVKHKTDVVTTG